ncbi:MAG TPA: hypothetical protein H9810_07470 [Candidatus Gemmiger excrementavium]|uniref:Tyr recombinase domain-containing protein n=1 Tax=Candidatus Gemmiger excrementavium TaxID=2838608 RepID=A0A9D2F3J2_9FIRM|nr:hypothetical protein [Candidatus Gemmiger excrementavium]
MKLKQWAQDWFAAWQASHIDSYRTEQSYQGLLQNTILPRLGKYELAELTPLRLKHFFAGLPDGKAKNTYKLLRTILQQAVAAQQMAENPCTPEILSEEVLAKRKAGPHREQPVFTRVEQEKLLAVCEEELWGDLIRFAFATGLSQGELLALREEDVDLVANLLIVRNRIVRIADEQTEGRKTRLALLPVQPYSVPLPAACKRIVESQLRTLRTLQAVDARCNPDHLLFATPDGRPIEANVLREHLALLERRAGVPGLTFSAIRETIIRQALEDGGTDAEVMERFHCKDRQAFLRRYREK